MTAGLAAAALLAGIVVLKPWEPRGVAPERIVEVPPVPEVHAPPPTLAPVKALSSAPAVAAKAIPHPESRKSELEVLIDPREAAAFRRFVNDIQEKKVDMSRLERLFEAAERAGTSVEPMPIAGLEIEIKPLTPAASETERGGNL